MRIAVSLAIVVLAAGAQARTIHYGTGTGFYVNKHGHVITNAHVVPDCTEITVDGQAAQLINANRTLDIAILKVPGGSVRIPAPLRRNIQALRRGDKAVLMGFPGRTGFDGILTYRTGRVLIPLTDMQLPQPNPQRLSAKVMAIDSIAQKGNSGGPVLDQTGRVIGVIRGTGSYWSSNAQGQKLLNSEVQASFAIPLALLEPYLRSHNVYLQFEDGGAVPVMDSRLQEHARNFILPIRCRKADTR